MTYNVFGGMLNPTLLLPYLVPNNFLYAKWDLKLISLEGQY